MGVIIPAHHTPVLLQPGESATPVTQLVTGVQLVQLPPVPVVLLPRRLIALYYVKRVIQYPLS